MRLQREIADDRRNEMTDAYRERQRDADGIRMRNRRVAQREAAQRKHRLPITVSTPVTDAQAGKPAQIEAEPASYTVKNSISGPPPVADAAERIRVANRDIIRRRRAAEHAARYKPPPYSVADYRTDTEESPDTETRKSRAHRETMRRARAAESEAQAVARREDVGVSEKGRGIHLTNADP